MYKKKRVSIYYCSECGTEFGTLKPTVGCKHEVCGHCEYYNRNGFCSHAGSLDMCADRDSDAICDIDRFEAIAKE